MRCSVGAVDEVVSGAVAGPERRRPGAALVARTVDVLAGPREPLTAHETRRGARLRSLDDQLDHLAAHLLVRRAAARLLPAGCAPVTLLQQCPECGQDGHGRPSVPEHPGLHVSLSHTRGAVAAVAAWSPVGIDIENRSGTGSRPETLWAETMTAAEEAAVDDQDPASGFRRLWVRKEALVKVGAASLDRLADVDLSALPLPAAPGAGRARRWGSWTLTDWSDDDYVAAVAAAGPVRVEVWRTGP